MPLNRAVLAQVDKITKDDIPDLGDDEYIEIAHVRDFSRDVEAEMVSQRYLPSIPREGEEESIAASRAPTLRRHDSLYWRAVWEYMCVRLHVQDEHGVWMDAATPVGTKQDRDDVWKAWGAFLFVALGQRFGSIASTVEGEVDANGEPLTFPDASVLQPQEHLPGEAEPGLQGDSGTLPIAQDGTGPSA